jgi:hypothetical protein
MANNSTTGRRALLDLMLDGKHHSTRELMDAVAKGNKATLQSYISDLRGMGLPVEGEVFYVLKKMVPRNHDKRVKA